MPRHFQMTYVQGRNGWMKKYKGEMYAVSCKQLGAPPTKDQSWMQANAWWEAKKAEIDAAERAEKETPEAKAEAKITAALATLSSEELTALMVKARSAESVCMMQAVAGAEGGMDFLVNKELESGLVSAAVNAVSPNAPVGRSMAEQVQSWLTILQASVRQGLMHTGRWESYERHVKMFSSWIGETKPIDVITATKLEEWYAHLTVLIAEGRYSPATCQTVFMTTRQFVSRLAELGIIPLPGNIRSKRFRFNLGAGEIKRLTVEQTKAVIKAAGEYSERTTLYILLMLNCGMYQNDLAELSEDEVDWGKGTITRPRSKRQDGAKTTWKLWPETFALLKKFRATKGVPNMRGQNRMILTEDGKALCNSTLVDGKLKRYDVVVSAMGRLIEAKKLPKFAIKQLRKTSASELGKHPTYGQYVQHFLCHSPKGVADRHYVKPDDEQFFAALDWLRERFLSE
jgi:integrase